MDPYIVPKRVIAKPKISSNEARLNSLKKALPALILPIIVVGGIYAGFFTPTEAAGVGVFFAFVLGFFWYRTLNLFDVIPIFKDSLHSTCMILLLIAGSMVLGHAITTLQNASAESLYLCEWIILSFNLLGKIVDSWPHFIGCVNLDGLFR